MAERTCTRRAAAILLMLAAVGGCSGGAGPLREKAPPEVPPPGSLPAPDVLPPLTSRPGPPPAPESEAFDTFGTRKLHPTAPGGRTWAARWGAPSRTLREAQQDPYDPELQTRGANLTVTIPGDGRARLSGETVRIYLGAPDRTWLNTELTVYAMRVSEWHDAPTSTGFEFQFRTGDGHQSERETTGGGLDRHCLGHAYGASLRFDGRVILEKELKHPHYSPQVDRRHWGEQGPPRNTWLGLKVLVYNLPGGRVAQEIWLDLTDGRDGGTWRKVHEHVDAGGWSINPRVAATCGIPADHRITTPQPFIILRNDKVREQWLKKLTVREITPPP